MRQLPYEVVDVFTDRPFTGNPLAVVFGAADLGRDQMQALAREFHLSETVFALPPTTAGAEAGATYRARIFTPREELPFAGHPSVGVAVTQVRRGVLPVGRVWQECGAGVLPIDVSADGRATLTGGTATIGTPLDPGPLLSAVGLDAADYAGHVPRMAGCGVEFAYLSVRPGALDRAQVPAQDCPVSGVCVFAWDGATATAQVRFFAPALGVPEDPATGSAALGLGVFLVAADLLPGGDSSYVVHQGEHLHRPSQLSCVVSAVDGTVTRATVTGSVVPIAHGEVAVPPFVG